MEFNTVPYLENTSANGKTYRRIPRMRFPVHEQGLTFVSQDWTAYSKAALYDGMKTWLGGGAASNGSFGTTTAAAVKTVLVVGADALCRTTVYGFRSLGAHTRTACRPFDVDRDGMSIGEGAGFALLELGEGETELAGVATRTDAHHLTAPEPGGEGLIRAIRAATRGFEPGEIDHVNAHATGTPTNDGVEARALAVAAPGAWITATKGATGHTLGAAGVIEAVLLAESMRRGIVPASRGCQNPIEGVAVANVPRARVQRLGVSVNLAFGGHNAALALRFRGAA